MSIFINELSEEEIIVVSDLKEMYDLAEKAEGIMFEKPDFKRLNAAVRRVNNVLRWFLRHLMLLKQATLLLLQPLS